ncbi:hypothetical protein SAMN05443287_11438 [Micromonospora phaseoli]|uniref:Lipoprotein n=1 Tax=Micromonospora phaseoli TaxID=1144548 RepID=A0A1H7DPC3_9ACTN|nr:hypothetical protein [Micromonospora phaseoli]PZW02320.1 hypothetical protein CLV64_102694 [Micromonospora phaseoli]GIJ75678.1 hypothetical protein Xph01_01100 [Micromonospora phaseoli]SEK01130.1 hypothetical protein SAMN05443287_11438 [Micromonospora phaseoli]
MIALSQSRLASLSVTALLAVVLSGCAPFGGQAEPEQPASPPADAPPGAGGAATAGKGRVSLLQNLGTDGPLRTLNVEPDGRWECVDCAGDGVTSTGALTDEQRDRLQSLLAEPALVKETDEVRGYRVTCIGALTSSLLTSTGLITSQDCPGEERPPVAEEILLLLTQNTPAELVSG